MTPGEPTTDGRRTPSYRAFCPTCRKSGRTFLSYGSAEKTAQGHADKHRHVTHVIDQYGIRVVGSIREPS